MIQWEIPDNMILPEDIPELIRKTAEEICGCYYQDEDKHGLEQKWSSLRRRRKTFRDHWPNQKEYVRRNWASFIPVAREVLGQALNMGSTPIEMKEQIYEAFLEQGANKNLIDASQNIMENLKN